MNEDIENSTQVTESTFEHYTNIAKNVLLTGAAIYGIAQIAIGAFDRNSRADIWKRANGESELNPELTGFKMECSHFDHDRAKSYYNQPSNGLLVTSLEHYVFHLMHMENPEDIGLTYQNNLFAIEETCKRAENDAKRLGWSIDKFDKQCNDSFRDWIAYLSRRNAEA